MKTRMLPIAVSALLALGAVAHSGSPTRLSSLQRDAATQDLGKATNKIHPVVRTFASAARGELLLSGEVSVISAPKSNGRMTGVGGIGGIQIAGNGASTPAGPGSFKGKLEIARTKKGELIVASHKIAPGFVLYKDGPLQLVQSLRSGAAMSLGSYANEIPTLLDFEALMLAAKSAEFEEIKAADGVVTGYTFDLPRSLLQSESRLPPGFNLTPSVTGIHATVEMRPGLQELLSLRFEVVRNDPFARFSTLRGDVAVAKGGGVQIVRAVPEKQEEAAAGPTTVFEFRRRPAGVMSKRLGVVLERMRDDADALDHEDLDSADESGDER